MPGAFGSARAEAPARCTRAGTSQRDVPTFAGQTVKAVFADGNSAFRSRIPLVSLMRMRCQNQRSSAFTRIELLVALLTLAVLIGVLLPAMIRRKSSTQLSTCVVNLKQVILAELLWISDNEKGRVSWQYSTNEKGTWEYLESGKLSPHLKALSNEVMTPKIFVCAADDREAARSLTTLSDSNVSYFMNMDPGSYTGPIPMEKPWRNVIFGDRNVTNSTGSRTRISITASNYTSLGWSSRMHNEGRESSQRFRGNVAYADGSVETVTPTNLQKAVMYTDTRLALP